MYTLRESRRGPWRPEAQRFVVNALSAQLGPRLSQRSPRALVLEPTWNGWNEIDYSKFMPDPPTQEPPSRLAPEAPKIEVGDVLESQDAHKRCLRPVQRGPRGAQEAFKSAQEMSKRRLRGPRRLQTPSKIKPGKVGTRPGRVRVRSGSTWRTYHRKKRSLKSLRTSFVLFFR